MNGFVPGGPTAEDRVPLDVILNGVPHRLMVRMHDSLLDALRNTGFAGAKRACETADCGACSVLLDGRLVVSCALLALQAEGSRVDTIEGLATRHGLHPLQEAFLRHGAAQCGFCTPGMLVSMVDLLARRPLASEAEIRDVLGLCRCTGYVKPVAAVQACQERAGNAPRALPEETR